MKKEDFERAKAIQDEIYALNQVLKGTNDVSPSLGITIQGRNGYYNMGIEETREIRLRGDIAKEIWDMAQKHIQVRINELLKEFDEL